ncbi:MAG: NAD+ synthase [Fidelibacterota bacterium]
MKIALCQLNPTVGAFTDNRRKMLQAYKEAVQAGATLIVFPELVVTGYPPQDLLYDSAFMDSCRAMNDDLTAHFQLPTLFGTVESGEAGLYNRAILAQHGKRIGAYTKRLLPTYDVFDEDRYFTPGTAPGVFSVNIAGETVKIGVEICEDLWDQNYPVKVTADLAAAGVDLIVNISASPFHEGRREDRAALIRSTVRETGIPFYYCNLVGAQDELIFDGNSLAVDREGRLIGIGAGFQEDMVLIQPDRQSALVLPSHDRESQLVDALVLGIRDYFQKTGHGEAVIGLSGGIDSSLVAALAVEALGRSQVHGVSLPSTITSDHSRSDALELAKNLGIDFREIPIAPAVESYNHLLKTSFSGTESGVAEENIQARIRGNLLMALANKFGWLVLTTGNKTELALGYCTLYGDMSGALAVISDLSKSDVYALSRKINRRAGKPIIPENCLRKPPSAELSPNQVDPFDYSIVSPLVDAIVEDHKSVSSLIRSGFEPNLVREIYHRIRNNEYKRRQAAPGLRVSPKAFGLGRRIPIVNHFNGEYHET